MKKIKDFAISRVRNPLLIAGDFETLRANVTEHSSFVAVREQAAKINAAIDRNDTVQKLREDKDFQQKTANRICGVVMLGFMATLAVTAPYLTLLGLAALYTATRVSGADRAAVMEQIGKFAAVPVRMVWKGAPFSVSQHSPST